jgi:transcription-repair coupling factor (superfamily II helicase)
MSELNYQQWYSEIAFETLVSGISQPNPAPNQPNQQPTIVNSLVSGALASFLLAIKTQFPQRPLVFISSQDSPSYLHKLQNQILRINENSKIQNLVYSQVSLLEGISESNHHFANISNVLSNWLNNNQSSNQQITLASPKAITQLVAEKNKFAQSQITLAKGQEINLPNLSKSLVEIGYTRDETVSEIGSFAVRGEIIDIFPADSVDSLPWRINLFGDEIESIRAFEQQIQFYPLLQQTTRLFSQ